MRPTVAALALALLALPGASQTPLDRNPNIPVEEWIAMASGRTLTYRIDGELWALERYDVGSNRVQLQLYDGTCLHGTWDYEAPHYCFHWQGQGTSCFRHTRVGDEILIIESRDGSDTPLTQSMTAVTDTPLTCAPHVGS
jgi:hypothetical protein